MTLLLASCNEDYKDWAEPQSNPQGSEIVFGSATASGVDLIDYAQLPEGTTLVKVCDLTIPAVSDTNYYADTYIFLNGEQYSITNDGYMDAAALEQYVVDHYGRALEQRDIPARVMWIMTNGTTSTTMTSDEFIVHVILTPVTIPDLWYLAGAPFGDGNGLKGADYQKVGVSLVPMYGTPGAVTILTYVGFIPANKTFKIFHNPGDPDQFSLIGGEIVRNTGDGANIRVTKAGYYRITLDTDIDKVTIEPYEGTVVGIHSMITMPGDYQGWDAGSNAMTAINVNYENHDWIVSDFTVTESAKLKFANGSWDVNWGGEGFPVGAGYQDGPNINVNPGHYTVMFNDILGYYYFMEQ